MKVIYNSIIPFPGFGHINLFGVLFGRKECKNKLTRRTYTHESIHSEQYKELGFIFFIPLYLLEWLIKIPFSWFYKQPMVNKVTKVAYRSISLEQEAFYNQYDYDYLSKRKRYTWLKYIFKMYDPDKAVKRTSPEEYITPDDIK